MKKDLDEGTLSNKVFKVTTRNLVVNKKGRVKEEWSGDQVEIVLARSAAEAVGKINMGKNEILDEVELLYEDVII